MVQEISNDSADPAVSIASIRVQPGVTTAWHRLINVSERYCILEGRGMMQIGYRQEKEVSTGDVVWIPANTPQRISNSGDIDLVFLAICTPRFTASCYEHLE